MAPILASAAPHLLRLVPAWSALPAAALHPGAVLSHSHRHWLGAQLRRPSRSLSRACSLAFHRPHLLQPLSLADAVLRHALSRWRPLVPPLSLASPLHPCLRSLQLLPHRAALREARFPLRPRHRSRPGGRNNPRQPQPRHLTPSLFSHKLCALLARVPTNAVILSAAKDPLLLLLIAVAFASLSFFHSVGICTCPCLSYLSSPQGICFCTCRCSCF